MPNDRAIEPVLLTSVQDGIALLTLNRARQYNALSGAVLASLHEQVDAVGADASVRVVVIAAAGGAFCAGHDLKEMRSAGDAARVEALFASSSALMRKLVALPVPVIAAVNGIATAAGCQLVAQCDLAVASADARFAVSGVNLGLFCSTPAVPLSRNIGRKRAAQMLFTGDFIDAATALDWGLVNEVCPPERLGEAVRELANNLKNKPRETLALGKALFYRQLEAGLDEAYRDATCTISSNMADPVAGEGVDAFLQKRPPSWKR
ncbi:MAG TPA: enoyl-CoA hydratase [Casimicrobiaceae bacterium]